jgi:hypothetical protein
MMKIKYIWSAVHGGCIMEQRFNGKIWRDWNSLDEGMHPTLTPRVKALVKWYNLDLKRREKMEKVAHLQTLLANALSKVYQVEKKQEKIWEAYKGS